MIERRLIAVRGVVQGVGFRPFVHRLAAAGGLRGTVRNDAAGVTIDVEGDAAQLDAFLRTLTREPPALATIDGVDVASALPGAHHAFSIARSFARAEPSIAPSVPTDAATCAACLAELFDPRDRRFGHPFISCTDCGPRLTIIRDTPYDRERTTMAAFAMCDACRREYEDPRDRRFHAEAIACNACGPVLRAVAGPADEAPLTRDAALRAGIDALRVGKIVAIKALGGYHLACDATSDAAVSTLRARKHRPAKPLAVMVRDVAAARALCVVSAAEADLLASPARPIVLLARRADSGVAHDVAPAQRTLGVMLPSTPLHHLIVAAMDLPLVMTSGNRSDEPVATDEASAFAALGGIADLFLTHARDIAARCDDSVARIAGGDVRMVRRARGYAPRTVPLGVPSPLPVLGMGGHLKSTVCLAHGTSALVSPHVGDLGSWDARRALRDAIGGVIRMTGATPRAMAHDLHPDYASTREAQALAGDMGIDRLVGVQHHHAHVAACIAEHGIRGPVIGVAFDGAGLGTDGATWGGEFLVAEGSAFGRCGHLAYVALPGGDAAARQPWRSAASHTAAAGVFSARPVAVPEHEWNLVQQLLGRAETLPRTSSIGRLFDAVASLLGVCHVSRHEGEAAMALEAVADSRVNRAYPVRLAGADPWTADAGPIIHGVLDDLRRGRGIGEIAGAFHHALRDLVVAGCGRIRGETGIAAVVLTGGVFMNALLLAITRDALSERGFRVFIPRLVPANDGGLSLGQAFVALHALREDTCA